MSPERIASLTLQTEVLEIERSASKDEVRKAYRKVCRLQGLTLNPTSSILISIRFGT